MQRYSINDSDIFPLSAIGGYIDFDKNDPFEKMCLQIIDTPEYRRMQQIPQLGFVDSAIPSACHTRFEHCIGAYDISRTLLYWSNRNYNKPRHAALRFNDTERAAMAAALLHDIGHAFPGHPFERTIKKLFPKTYQNHEKRGVEIIQKSGIYNILNGYAPGFADNVLSVMAENDLPHSIWQQIHCGNLNSDTLDYLMRDTMFATDNQNSNIGYRTGLARRLIEQVIFDNDANGNPRLSIGANAYMDYCQMLGLRADMYANIYFAGAPAAAESYLEQFFAKIGGGIQNKAMRDKFRSLSNPFIDYIDGMGTNYETYLKLNNHAFYSMLYDLALNDFGEISNMAADYQNISKNFHENRIFAGLIGDPQMPSDSDIADITADAERNGNIFSDKTINFYNKNAPEVFISATYDIGAKKEPFSKLNPDMANAKMRIISVMERNCGR
jgi:HD superfamily phosphohydrolase